MKRLFQKQALYELQFWGGEPTYGFSRVLETLDYSIDYFPNLKRFMFSTNLTTKTCIEDIKELIEFCVNKDLNRHFEFSIQLSLDGPPDINDYNRGQNVTKLFTENFRKLVEMTSELAQKYQNFNLLANFKPTLDSFSLERLQTKEKIYKYYKFFEDYKTLWNNIDPNTVRRRHLFLAPPNTADPGTYTQMDGVRFKNYCKICYELMLENKENHIFSYWKNIMPYLYNGRCNHNMCNDKYGPGVAACGTGFGVLGLLPNNMISTCHNGFVELLADYKKQAEENAAKEDYNSSLDSSFFSSNTNQLVYTEEEFEIFCQKMIPYYLGNKFSTIEMGSLITTLAETGQIEEQYKDPKKAIEAVKFISFACPNCIRNNLNTTQSIYLWHTGLLKILFNGAKEYIELAQQFSSSVE